MGLTVETRLRASQLGPRSWTRSWQPRPSGSRSGASALRSYCCPATVSSLSCLSSSVALPSPPGPPPTTSCERAEVKWLRPCQCRFPAVLGPSASALPVPLFTYPRPFAQESGSVGILYARACRQLPLRSCLLLLSLIQTLPLCVCRWSTSAGATQAHTAAICATPETVHTSSSQTTVESPGNRVRRPWNHQGINSPLYGEAQRAGLASSNHRDA